MIHESDIAKDTKAAAEKLKQFTKGEFVECKVLSIDVEKERVALGIRQISGSDEDSSSEASHASGDFAAYKKDDVHTCTISTIRDDGVEVSLSEGISGFIKKQDLSSEKSEQKPDRFAVGDRVDAKVLSVSKQKNLVNLSIKALENEERNKAIKEYGSADSGASLGDILGQALKGNTK
jgi:small subunit ribosomal protein S1